MFSMGGGCGTLGWGGNRAGHREKTQDVRHHSQASIAEMA